MLVSVKEFSSINQINLKAFASFVQRNYNLIGGLIRSKKRLKILLDINCSLCKEFVDHCRNIELYKPNIDLNTIKNKPYITLKQYSRLHNVSIARVYVLASKGILKIKTIQVVGLRLIENRKIQIKKYIKN